MDVLVFVVDLLPLCVNLVPQYLGLSLVYNRFKAGDKLLELSILLPDFFVQIHVLFFLL